MPDRDDPIIFDPAKDAEVPDAIAPQPGEFATQGFPERTRVVRQRDALAKEAGDPLLDGAGRAV